MSDEERKAIKILKINPEIIADLDEEMFEKMCEFKEESIKELKYWASQTALNLIDKQSKEIEELKNGQIDFWISDKEIEERIRNKFVSKDKIKAKTIEIKNRPVKDEFITASQGKLNTIIDMESLLEKE